MKFLLSLIVSSLLLAFKAQEAQAQPKEEVVQDRVETKEEISQINNKH